MTYQFVKEVRNQHAKKALKIIEAAWARAQHKPQSKNKRDLYMHKLYSKFVNLMKNQHVPITSTAGLRIFINNNISHYVKTDKNTKGFNISSVMLSQMKNNYVMSTTKYTNNKLGKLELFLRICLKLSIDKKDLQIGKFNDVIKSRVVEIS